jgi:hypothetical protein
VSDEIEAPPPRGEMAAHVRVVRVGPGANCSSVGSVVDTLFATAAVAAAVFAAVAGALAAEPIRTRRRGPPPGLGETESPEPPDDAERP